MQHKIKFVDFLENTYREKEDTCIVKLNYFIGNHPPIEILHIETILNDKSYYPTLIRLWYRETVIGVE